MAGKSERLKVYHRQRTDLAENWTAADPVLLEGEMGIESDTRMFKFGDGVRRWSELGYVNTAGGAGEKGDKGDQGEPGKDGAPGEKGDKGDPGAPGEKGEQGEKGEKGDPGERGAAGAPGAPGADGKDGIGIGTVTATVDDSTGEPSVTVTETETDNAKNLTFAFAGIKGDKGDKGDQGPQGVQGLQGLQGEPGAAGAPGKDGKDGAPGEKGDKGDKGEPGTPGANGKDGATPTIGENGNWCINGTDTNKPSRGEKGDKGDTGERGATGPKGDTGARGATGEQGPAGKDGADGKDGEEGPAGPAGPKGDAGERGPQGDKGEKGEKGAPGAAAGFGTPIASVDSGTGTPSVTITASGPDTAKVFNFKFSNLKGEKGDPGESINPSLILDLTSRVEELETVLNLVKEDIKAAIEEQGVLVGDETPFSQYADKIRMINRSETYYLRINEDDKFHTISAYARDITVPVETNGTVTVINDSGAIGVTANYRQTHIEGGEIIIIVPLNPSKYSRLITITVSLAETPSSYQLIEIEQQGNNLQLGDDPERPLVDNGS